MNPIRYSICLLLGITLSLPLEAQICDPTTPVYTVNLSGQPNGVWVSPAGQRAGNCCGSTPPDKCVQFIITLDSSSTGIHFDIASGAVPPGALYYQINCGPPIQVGQPVCLNGAGPHVLTFCKPGNNTNSYQIAAMPYPAMSGSQYASEVCAGFMSVTGLIDTSITWTSIPPNPVHNSYLSCLKGCDSVSVLPTGIFPAYVDYEVCGFVLGGCNPYFFCDTVRVNFVSSLQVNVTPQNPVICYGSTTATVTANTSGGSPPYAFLWSTGATTQSIAVGGGTYTVTVQDSLSCTISSNSVTVTSFTVPITANAGADQLVCTNQGTVQLNGQIGGASGGQWTGNGGTFSPHDSALNATYSPTPGEITAGSTTLTLVTTGTQGCPGDTDQVVVQFSQSPAPNVSGDPLPCAYSTGAYTAGGGTGLTYTWAVTGGTVLNQFQDTLIVQWGAGGAGNVQVTATNGDGCDSTVSLNVQVVSQPAPVINGPSSVCTGTSSSYNISSPVPGETYTWTVSGGTLTTPSTGTGIQVQWTNPGSAAVSVTAANGQGCDSTVSAPVNVIAQPLPAITGPASICEGETAVYTSPPATGHTFTWNVTGGVVVANNGNSISVQWPGSGTGNVTLTQSNAGSCDSTISIPVTISAKPSPSITGPVSVCTGTTSAYNLSSPVPGETYTWTVSGGILITPSTGTGIQVQWNSPATASVTVTASNSQGCDSAVSGTVNVYAQPSPNITGQTMLCAGATVVYATPPTTGHTYSWNVTGGVVLANNGNSITVQWPNAGSGVVSVLQSNAICDSSVAIPVTVASQPAPSINGPATACTGTSSVFNLTAPVPGTSYTWTVIGGTLTTPASGSSIQVQWIGQGTASIAVSASNSQGCDSTVSVPVNVFTQPMPALSGPVLLCAGETATYSTPAVTGHTYSWSVIGGNVVSSNNNTVTVQWPAQGSGMIYLTQENSAACDSTATLPVTVSPQPSPNINGPTLICSAYDARYQLTNPVQGETYQWQVTGGTILGVANGTFIDVSWNNTGTAAISMTASNGFGCDSTVSINTLVRLSPAPEIGGPDTLCANDTATYYTPSQPGHQYAWTVTGGSIIGLNTGNSILVLWPASGTGSVHVHESTPQGCDSAVTREIIVNTVPQPQIAGPTPICENVVNTFTVAGNPGDTYSWSIGNGQILGPANGQSISMSSQAPGVVSLLVVQTNALGCVAQATLPVTVNAKPTGSIHGPATGCYNTTGNNYTVSSANNVAYQWSVTGGVVATGGFSSNAVINWNGTGMQTVSVTLTDLNTGCDSTVTFTVEVDSLQTLVLANSIKGCEATTIQFNGNSANPNYQYVWDFGDGTSSTSPNPSHHYSDTGSYPVTVIASNHTGCRDTATGTVNIYPNPTANFTVWYGTDIYMAGISEMEITNLSKGATTYLWNFGNGDLSTAKDPEYSYNEAGNFIITLRVENEWGCFSELQREIQVKVPEGLYIPNAFTPNGDHKNDFFYVGHDNITEFSIAIFNRWGETVFQSHNPGFKWDGKFMGQPCTQAVYVYKLKATGFHGRTWDLIGTVTLVR